MSDQPDDLDKEIPLSQPPPPPPPRKARGRPARPRNPVIPEALTANVQQVQTAIDKVTKVVHEELQPNDVVQVISGDNTGVLLLVGRVEGDTIKGYQIQPHGDRPLIDAKLSEVARIGKGRKAWKMPEESETPDWHENRPLPQ